MSEEAMKLALEALENNRRTHYYCEDTWYSCPKHEEGCANESEGDECNCGADKANVEIDGAIIALREALTKPDFWENYVPEPVKPAQCKYPKCSYPCTDLPDCRDAEQPAQQALDKKAENARALGLDYEPVCNKDPQGCWNVRCQLGKKCKEQPAQQEPVAWISEHRFDELRQGFPVMTTLTKHKAFEDDVAFYTSPPAQRKPLTDEQIDAEFDAFASKFDHESDDWLDMGVDAYFRAGFKAAHGIKENT